MTVLRSREIAPAIKSQSPLETLGNGTIEPATPPKTLEEPNHAVYGTPNSTASTPSAPPVGLGSYSVPVLGATRRRSARLASVSSVDEIAPNIVVSNRKRKTVGAKNSIGRNLEPLLENIGGDAVGITENRGKKFRDFDRIGMDRVSGELGIAMEVEEKVGTDERKLDLNASVVNDEKEKGQRQLDNGDDLLALELAREGESDKGFLNLRSGKKIFMGKMEIKSGDVGFAEFVSDDGDKSVSVNGGEDEDKASGKNGGIEKGILMDKFIRDVGGDGLGNLKGRRRSSRALMPKADDWAERVELDLNCEVELPAGNHLSETGRLPGNVGLNALEKGETNDETDPGVTARRRLSIELKGKGKVAGDGLLSNGNAVSDTIQSPENGGHPPADDSHAVKSRRISREEKGKGKVVGNELLSNGNAISNTANLPENVGLKTLKKDSPADNSHAVKSRRISREEKGKGKVVGNELLSNGNAISDTAHLPENVGLKTLKKDSPADDGRALKSRRRISREEKGKGKVVVDGLLSNGIDAVELGLEPKGRNSAKNSVSRTPSLPNDISVQDESQSQAVGTGARANASRESDYKVRFREIAKQNASRFALFSSEEAVENHVTDEPESQMPIREADREIEDWPGPFSTAMKIIKDREMSVNLSQKSSFLDKSKPASVLWVPKRGQQLDHPKQSIPQLQDLCMEILAKNADAITSLWGVPDVLRHRLSQLLCDSRRMNSNFLDLLVQGSPTEIRIRDCSWLTEEQLTRTFQGCEASNLMVLQLDQCGRCMSDYVLSRLPNSLPALTTISLKGACRLSDDGLRALVASAPVLRSINLSQCSLLTSVGIQTLADSLGPVLRELYLDDCQSIDPMLILPALSKLEHLEVLSLAGIQTVCDDFVSKFIALCGHNMKELVLADCVTLTDSSLKVIAETCAGLCVLDLGNLDRLTDSTLGYLANGCRAIQTLKLCRNSFSDEAVAAYLEAAGESLKELSLNNISKVGHNTAISLARRSRKLCCLDLSWCRNLTNEALGLIVDSCLSLKVLKLFGCTQITSVFLDGHSNPQVQIIGLKMTPILKHLKVPDPLEGPLHYSSVSS